MGRKKAEEELGEAQAPEDLHAQNVALAQEHALPAGAVERADRTGREATVDTDPVRAAALMQQHGDVKDEADALRRAVETGQQVPVPEKPGQVAFPDGETVGPPQPL